MKIKNKKTGAEYSSSTLIDNSKYGDYFDDNTEVYGEFDIMSLSLPNEDWEEVTEEPHWKEIERYEDGLAVDTCINEMFSNLPICVKRGAGYEIIMMPDDEALFDYKYVVRNDSDYAKWCKIKLL